MTAYSQYTVNCLIKIIIKITKKMFLIIKDDQLDLISVLISTYVHYEQ